MDVAFAQPRRSHPQETRPLLKFANVLAAAVAHAGPQSTYQLIHQLGERPFVRHAALDALRHQLAAGVLRVAVRRSLRHRAHGAHAAVALERTPLIQNRLARAFFGSGQQAPDHHRIGSGRDGLADIARELDAAIGDKRHSRTTRSARALGDRSDLRHTRTADHAGGADGSRTDADLDPIGAQIDQIASAFKGGHVTGNQVHVRQFVLNDTNSLHDAVAMAVGGVHYNDVHFLGYQLLGAFQIIAHRTHRRADAQPALRILGRVGVLQLLLDVLDGDQALEREVLVHHQQLLHAMLMQNLFGFLQRGPHRHRDQVLLRHHLRDGKIVASFESQVAIRQDADQLAVLGDRHARDTVVLHQLQRVRYSAFRLNGDWIDDHAALTALHAIHFFGLPVHRHIAMNDTDAALLREGNGQMRFSDRVHGRAHDGDVHRDAPRQTGTGVGVCRQHSAARRLKKHVVESETFQNGFLHEGVILLCREPAV